jgi:hypothetical protein
MQNEDREQDIRDLHEAGHTAEELQALQDAGKTAAEIADDLVDKITAILVADPRHARDVMATSSDTNDTDLVDVLGEFGLIGISDNGGWEGPLVDAVLASKSAPLIAGWSRLKMNLQITNRPVRCGTNPAIGALVTALTGLAMQSQQDKAAEISETMDALTGGRRYAGLTVGDVRAVIAAEAARVQESLNAEKRQLWNARFDAAMNTIGTVEQADGVADLRLMADEMEA